MKKFKWILSLAFLLAIQIYASPANDTIEFAASICQFSDSGLKCSCSEETIENRNEQKKIARKVRNQNF